MYTTLLSIHSIVRWLILITFIYTFIRALYGWILKKEFNKSDKIALTATASLAHLQLLLGIWLYFVSPIAHFFIHNFKFAIKLKEYRFFGMEHALIMLIAIVLITIGSSIAKRKNVDTIKFKTIVIWYGIGLILILSAIPYH